jgi:hypothetical protein
MAAENSNQTPQQIVAHTMTEGQNQRESGKKDLNIALSLTVFV